MSKISDNIEYSEEWLIAESLKTFYKEKDTKQVEMITISKLDLLKLIIKFIKLNKNGG